MRGSRSNWTSLTANDDAIWLRTRLEAKQDKIDLHKDEILGLQAQAHRIDGEKDKLQTRGDSLTMQLLLHERNRRTRGRRSPSSGAGWASEDRGREQQPL
jgi:hypothetical protein